MKGLFIMEGNRKTYIIVVIIMFCFFRLSGQCINQLLPTDTIWVVQCIYLDTVNKKDYFTGFTQSNNYNDMGLYYYSEISKKIKLIKKTGELFKVGEKNDSIFYFFHTNNKHGNINHDIVELNIRKGNFSIKTEIAKNKIYESKGRNIFFYQNYILWIGIHEESNQLELYYKNDKPNTIKFDKQPIAVDFDTLSEKVNVLVNDSFKLFLYSIPLKSNEISSKELFINDLPYTQGIDITEDQGYVLKVLDKDLILFGYYVNKEQSKLFLYSTQKGKLVKSITINARILDIYPLNSEKMIISLTYEKTKETPFIHDPNYVVYTNTCINLFELDISKCIDGHEFTPR